MRQILIRYNAIPCAILMEGHPRCRFFFHYLPDYKGPPISVTLPLKDPPLMADELPNYFKGLLPQGVQLEILEQGSIPLSELSTERLSTGGLDMPGAITIHPLSEKIPPVPRDEAPTPEIPTRSTLLSKEARALKTLPPFPLSRSELLELARKQYLDFRLPGKSPKILCSLNLKTNSLEPKAIGGNYILKPQHPTIPYQPENESLTMDLAELAGVPVPLHGLIESVDGQKIYYIRRFDRMHDKENHFHKIHMENFVQLTNMGPFSHRNPFKIMSQLTNRYCSFSSYQMVNLFKLALFLSFVGIPIFSFKKFSLLFYPQRFAAISPFYGLRVNLNHLSNVETDWPSDRSRKGFFNFGTDDLDMMPGAVNRTLQRFPPLLPSFLERIENSHLPQELRDKYAANVLKNFEIFNS